MRISVIAGLLGLVVAACARAPAPLPEVPEPSPTAAPPVSLPRDAGPHTSLTEWWYYTGHLRSAQTGREYGFEFTIFQAERQGAPSGLLAHFAISDMDGLSFSHQARFVQLPSGAAATFPLDVDGWQLGSTSGSDTITAAMSQGPGVAQPYVLALTVSDQKPPALHNGGYIEYGIAGGSYYYSRTRLTVSGTLADGSGEPQAVDGSAWMDHQWGNFVVTSSGGWDWYSLQLDDRTELMLYVLRAPSGETTGVYGTEVLADGTLRDLLPGTVTSVPLGTWTSPHTGATYPAGWVLTRADGSQLRIAPALADQELYFPGLSDSQTGLGVMAYWEGAVRVTGDRTGVGYVELTGYSAQ
ncbi:MAG: lipocalin-like domain-containing protein [Chloroflexota bacterium]